jgi:hypothetical protein
MAVGTFEVVVPGRRGARPHAWRVAAALGAVMAGCVVLVALARGGAGARSEAQRGSWEQRSSDDINFWRLRAHGQNGVPNHVNNEAQMLYDRGLIRRRVLKHAGLHTEALQAKDSEDEPPFIGADIAGAMGNGRISGEGSTGNFKPMPTDDYAMYGPAMTFTEHDVTQRRMRDMVDDEGVPRATDSYQVQAKDKDFLKPLLDVPSGYGTLNYDLGKEGMYKYTR